MVLEAGCVRVVDKDECDDACAATGEEVQQRVKGNESRVVRAEHVHVLGHGGYGGNDGPGDAGGQDGGVEEKEDDEDEPKPNEPTDISYLKGQKGVPDFWFRAMKNNRLVWDQVKEKDEEILKGLKHVETEAGENEESKNMLLTLKMEFAADNDHFTPEILTVTLEYESEDQVKLVKGTSISWLEGKDPTKKKIKKKQKHKKTGETRTVVKTVDADSFFNIF